MLQRGDSSQNTTQPTRTDNTDPPTVAYITIGVSASTVLITVLLVALWINKYRTLLRIVQDLRGLGRVINVPTTDSPASTPSVYLEDRNTTSDHPLERQKTRSVSKSIWKPPQQGPRFTKADLNLQKLIKAGKEGVFYKARMNRGTCKGHSVFTCKITKDGILRKQVEKEVCIMRKLVHHRNVLQLLDWNTIEEPYVLLMEYVSYGTLRSFLQANQDTLRTENDLQSLFTIAAYHIALAMEFLHSKMILHCDLALRNILVNRFPMEVKVAEFGLARDLRHTMSRRSSRTKQRRERVPLRWYPPEYFRNNYYNFKGDVWAFGIVLWEMQMFGTLPYPSLDRSEEVVCYISAGQKNTIPEECRPELLQIVKDCWLEPYTSRPSFKDIVRILGNVLENDADYVDVDNQRVPETVDH